MDDEKRRLRDEVAELSAAVRELRTQLAETQRAHCHGCHCLHIQYWPAPYPSVVQPTYPYWVTCGSTTTEAPKITTDVYTSSVTSTLPGTVTYS